jgi:hypothetical protein
VADHELTGRALDARFDAYLAAVGRRLAGPRRLRADVLDELRDGLHDAAARARREGATVAASARAAVREFGPASRVAAAFAAELAGARARRAATALLATGPLVGLAWVAAVAPRPLGGDPGPLTPALPLVGAAVVAGLLVLAATGRWGPRLPAGLPVDGAVVAVVAAALTDVLVLGGVLGVFGGAPALADPPAALGVAVAASALRLAACPPLLVLVVRARRTLAAR